QLVDALARADGGGEQPPFVRVVQAQRELVARADFLDLAAHDGVGADAAAGVHFALALPFLQLLAGGLQEHHEIFARHDVEATRSERITALTSARLKQSAFPCAWAPQSGETQVS